MKLPPWNKERTVGHSRRKHIKHAVAVKNKIDLLGALLGALGGHRKDGRVDRALIEIKHFLGVHEEGGIRLLKHTYRLGLDDAVH
jgi:hypothetical protein